MYINFVFTYKYNIKENWIFFYKKKTKKQKNKQKKTKKTNINNKIVEINL